MVLLVVVVVGLVVVVVLLVVVVVGLVVVVVLLVVVVVGRVVVVVLLVVVDGGKYSCAGVVRRVVSFVVVVGLGVVGFVVDTRCGSVKLFSGFS